MDNDKLPQNIMDRLTKVCLCKGINRASIKKAIDNGAKTIDEVQKATGVGSGSCHGCRCTPKIEELLDQINSESRN